MGLGYPSRTAKGGSRSVLWIGHGGHSGRITAPHCGPDTDPHLYMFGPHPRLTKDLWPSKTSVYLQTLGPYHPTSFQPPPILLLCHVNFHVSTTRNRQFRSTVCHYRFSHVYSIPIPTSIYRYTCPCVSVRLTYCSNNFTH